MKNFKITLIYIILAALLAGYIYFFERGPVKKEEEKKTKVFNNFVADDINDIQIENVGNTLTAEKGPIVLQKDDKDTWHILSPHSFLADESTIRSMLTAVGDFNPDVTIDKPTSLKDYGLDPPLARCTLKSKAGVSFVILIGSKDMTGSSSYIKSGDKDTVYMVTSYAADNLHKGINDYRDHTFFKTDPVVAKMIQVTRDGKVLAFEKDKNNNWSITRPVEARADTVKIRDLLNTISSLRIQDFVTDHPSSLSQYGLSSPHIRVEVWPSDGGASNAILVGHKKGKDAGLYAKSKDEPYVYLIGEYFDKNLDSKLPDYRDKTILQFDGGSAKSIIIRRGSQTFSYQKDAKGQWACPGRTNAGMEATSLLNQLSGITIGDFVENSAETGLSSPTFVAEVGLSDGTTRVFKFGKREKDKVYLTVNNAKDIYLVPDGVVSQMEGYYNTILTPVAVTTTPAAHK